MAIEADKNSCPLTQRLGVHFLSVFNCFHFSQKFREILCLSVVISFLFSHFLLIYLHYLSVQGSMERRLGSRKSRPQFRFCVLIKF